MEILHKAKWKHTGEWVEGYYIKTEESSYILTEIILGEFKEKTQDWVEVDPETVCVYTGKDDEKGQKIWSHDYVAFIDITSTESGYSEYPCAGEVVWDEETASFQVTNRLSAESYEVLDECTVIGNSFDNPDMLEDY